MGADLTSVQFAVLAKLAAAPGTDQNTLAGALSIDTSTLAEVCLRLASRGLIDRERSELDARRYRLYLTASGRAVLERHIPAVDAVGDALLAPLTERERPDPHAPAAARDRRLRRRSPPAHPAASRRSR